MENPKRDIDWQYDDEHNAVLIDGKYTLLDSYDSYGQMVNRLDKELSLSEVKGVIELLWDAFGGTVNELGYKVLDPHIGAIYGDAINYKRANEISERLAAKGFASTNIVYGVGSFTYQYNTRDTFGFAMKATYGELTHHDAILNPETGGTEDYIEAREIFKDPITDDGTKKSKKGLLAVQKVPTSDKGERLFCVEQGSNWVGEKTGELKTIFKDSQLIVETTLEEIRARL